MIIGTQEARLHKLDHIVLVTDGKLCTVEDNDLLQLLINLKNKEIAASTNSEVNDGTD